MVTSRSPIWRRLSFLPSGVAMGLGCAPRCFPNARSSVGRGQNDRLKCGGVHGFAGETSMHSGFMQAINIIKWKGRRVTRLTISNLLH